MQSQRRSRRDDAWQRFADRQDWCRSPGDGDPVSVRTVPVVQPKPRLPEREPSLVPEPAYFISPHEVIED